MFLEGGVIMENEITKRWEFASWLERHCDRNSGDYKQYEKAKSKLKCLEINYDDGIKIIVDYLRI